MNDDTYRREKVLLRHSCLELLESCMSPPSTIASELTRMAVVEKSGSARWYEYKRSRRCYYLLSFQVDNTGRRAVWEGYATGDTTDWPGIRLFAYHDLTMPRESVQEV